MNKTFTTANNTERGVMIRACLEEITPVHRMMIEDMADELADKVKNRNPTNPKYTKANIGRGQMLELLVCLAEWLDANPQRNPLV